MFKMKSKMKSKMKNEPNESSSLSPSPDFVAKMLKSSKPTSNQIPDKSKKRMGFKSKQASSGKSLFGR